MLDTNVVVSALVWGGTPYRLLRSAIEDGAKLFTSPVLLGELREVLGRGKFAARLARQSSSVEHALGQYAALTIQVTPVSTPRTVPDDADDDHVVAAAIAAKADLIVSGDGDLLRLGAVNGIPIVSAAEVLRRIVG